jgi:hypothetical protein
MLNFETKFGYVSLDSPSHGCQFGTQFNNFSFVLSKKTSNLNIESEIFKCSLLKNGSKIEDGL